MLHKYLFFLLLLLLPTQLAYHFWPSSSFVFGIRVDYLSPTVYLTDIVVVLLLVSWMWEKRRKLQSYRATELPSLLLRPFSLLLGSLVAWLLLTSLFVAHNQPAALYKLLKISELIFLGFYVARYAKFSILNSQFSRVLAIAVLYTSLIGITQFFLGRTIGGPLWLLGERTFSASTPGIALQTIGGQEYLRAYSTFSHPNSFAGFLLVAGVLLFPWKTLLTRVAAVLGITAFILTFSQGAWFAAVLLAGLFTTRRKIYTAALLLLVVLFSVIPLFSILDSQFTSPEFTFRLQLAEVAKQMFLQNPLFGVGLNNFIVRLPEFGMTPEVSWFLQPVHNVFLLVLAETGIIGLGLFLWFLFLTIRYLKSDIRQVVSKSSGFLMTGNWRLETALLVILITGALDHYWLTLQQNQMLLALVLGFIFSTNGLSQRS